MKILNPDLNLDQFFEKFSGRSLLMMDYDGTLAPFVKEREKALPYPDIIQKIRDLIKETPTKVIIVSGRKLQELEDLIDIPTLELWGSHGYEKREESGKRSTSYFTTLKMEGIQNGIKIGEKYFDEEFLEIKPFSLAVHWRQMDDPGQMNQIPRLSEEWSHLLEKYKLEILTIDQGIELRPLGINKGTVVEHLISQGFDGPIAFLGDDITDEDAFKKLGVFGLKVLVREETRPTFADIQISPPDELLAFLTRWEVSYGSHRAL